MSLEILSELPQMNMDTAETGCCPKFEPEKWDGKLFELKDLKMVKTSTKSFFYMPLNMGSVMGKTMNAITQAGADYTDRYLILSQDKSKWSCDHYFLVKSDVPSQEMVNFSGQFIAKVFEGGYGEMPNWIPELEAFIKREGKEMKSMYAFYTTCPKCVKHYGKNYVVLFGEI